jgi:hypothetical protein
VLATHRRTFVPREEFLSAPAAAVSVDADRFRADLDEAIDNAATDPYDR